MLLEDFEDLVFLESFVALVRLLLSLDDFVDEDDTFVDFADFEALEFEAAVGAEMFDLADFVSFEEEASVSSDAVEFAEDLEAFEE